MRRPLLVVMAGLGLVALVWFFVRSVREPALPASPQGAALALRTEAEPTRAPVDVTERNSEETAVEKPAVVPAIEAPAPWTDPTELELTAFAREVPAGTIEGIVLRGLKPVEGGNAWLGADSTGGLPWGTPEVWDAEPSVSRTTIGADGVFRFSGLGPDDYGIGVRAPDGATRHVYFDLPAEGSTQRIRIVLGSGGLRGHVFDEQGAPCVGWQIATYNWGNTLAGVQVIDGKETNAEGFYEFSGLVGGNYVVSAGPVANRGDPLTRTLMVELAAGEWKTVDFGAPQRAPSWSGRVLLPGGEPLELTALTQLWLEQSSHEAVDLDSGGTFQIHAAAGTYQLHFLAYTRVGAESVELGEIQIPDSDRVQDVVLPGAALRVRARYQGTQKDPDEALAGLFTRLSGQDRTMVGLRGSDGHEYFLGLAPGTYELRTSPPIQGAPSGKMPVVIHEADQLVELDIVIGDL